MLLLWSTPLNLAPQPPEQFARAPRVAGIIEDDDDLLLLAWLAFMQPQNIKLKKGE